MLREAGDAHGERLVLLRLVPQQPDRAAPPREALAVLGERKDLASGSKLIFDCVDKRHSDSREFVLLGDARLHAGDIPPAIRRRLEAAYAADFAMYRVLRPLLASL